MKWLGAFKAILLLSLLLASLIPICFAQEMPEWLKEENWKYKLKVKIEKGQYFKLYNYTLTYNYTKIEYGGEGYILLYDLYGVLLDSFFRERLKRAYYPEGHPQFVLDVVETRSDYCLLWIGTNLSILPNLTVRIEPKELKLKPGEKGEIDVTIENTGEINLTYVKYEVITPGVGYEILPEESTASTTGYLMYFNRSSKLKLKYVVKAGGQLGTYFFFVKIKYYPALVNKGAYYEMEEGELREQLAQVVVYKPVEEVEEKVVKVPKLTVTANIAPNMVRPGESAEVSFSIANVGNGTAYNVSIFIDFFPRDLEAEAPPPHGRVVGSIGYKIPLMVRTAEGKPAPLKPGVRTEPFTFRVIVPSYLTKPTTYTITIRVECFDSKGRVHTAETSLKLGVELPGKPFIVLSKKVSTSTVIVGEDITVTVEVKNLGTGWAKKVFIVDSFPKGVFKLVSGKPEATYEKLAPNETRTFSYTIRALATYVGELPSAEATFLDELGVKGTAEPSNVVAVKVLGLPKVTMDMKVLKEVITKGETTQVSYEVTNKGESPAYDIRFTLEVSKNLEVLTVMGGELGALNKVYVNVSELRPGEHYSVRLVLKGLVPGEGYVKIVEKTYTDKLRKKHYTINGGEDVYFEIRVPTVTRVLLTAVLVAMVLLLVYMASVVISRSSEVKRRARERLGL